MILINHIIILVENINYTNKNYRTIGEMAERLKAPVLKTGKGATLSWVRIPVSPPLFFIYMRLE